MIILQDFLPETLLNEVCDALISPNVQWYFNKSTVDLDYSHNNQTSVVDSPQFTHRLFSSDSPNDYSWLWPVARPILFFVEKECKIKLGTVKRCKANLTYPINAKGTKHHPLHVDDYNVDGNCYSLIFYGNDSDGDTIFFDTKKYENENQIIPLHYVKPERGKAVLFPSNEYHASSNPIRTQTRTVLNFVFECSGLDS